MDALVEGTPDAPQGVVDALGRTRQALRDFRHPRRAGVAFLEQLTVPLAELRHAAGKGIAARFGLRARELFVGFEEEEVQLVREVEAAPPAGAQEVCRLEARDAAGPGEEAPAGV